MAARQAALFQILLVIILSLIESRSGNNLRDDRLPICSRLSALFLRTLSRGLLFGVMIENRGTILRSRVGPLPVQLRGIVVLPENVQQLFIRNLGRIIVDLDRFGMPGAIRTNIFVRRILHLPTRVTDAGGDHARQLAEGRFHSPKTSCSKSSFSHAALS